MDMRAPRWIAVLAVTASFLIIGAAASWTTEGADVYHSSLFSAAIPAADQDAKVESHVTLSSPFGLGSFATSPLYSSATGAAYVTDQFCGVTAIRGGAIVASWSPGSACSLAIVSISLDDAAGLIVLQSAALSEDGVSTIQTLHADTLKSAGSPIAVPGSVSTRAVLLLGGYAWVPSAINSTVHRIDYLVAGRPTMDIAIPRCGADPSVPSRFAASAVSLGPSAGSLAVVTTDGCVTAIAAGDGSVLWTSGALGTAQKRTLSPRGAATPRFTLPPAVDTSAGHLYVGTVDGTVCCLLTGASTLGSLCWATGCSETGSTSVFSAGMAISPDDDAFHAGQVFLVDESGTLFALSTVDGTVVSDGGSLMLGRTLTAPVIVPGGLGFHWNALLVLSADGVLSAVSVGDGQTPSDDDSSDDDGVGNAGVVWALTLPAPGANASESGGRLERGATSRRELKRMPRLRAAARAGGGGTLAPGADFVSVVGIAVQDDGRIVIPTATGAVFFVAPAHEPPSGSSGIVLVLAVTVTVVTGVVAFTLVLWCAYRRRRSIARALFYRYRLRVAFLREAAQARQGASANVKHAEPHADGGLDDEDPMAGGAGRGLGVSLLSDAGPSLQ